MLSDDQIQNFKKELAQLLCKYDLTLEVHSELDSSEILQWSEVRAEGMFRENGKYPKPYAISLDAMSNPQRFLERS